MRILLVMFIVLSFTQIFIFYWGSESLTGKLIYQEPPKGTIGEVISVPLQIGEEKKFELTGDTYYDLGVMLDSIEDSKANLKFKRVFEKIPGNLNYQKEVMFSPPLVDTSGARNENTEIIIISFVMIATAMIFLMILHFIPPFMGP